MSFGIFRSGLAAVCILASCLRIAPATLAQATPLSALAKMPVKELTVFKDGHAFVVHEGKMPTDGAGNVQMDYLPTPVIGTFWPYSLDKAVKLNSIVASPRRVKVERTVLSLQDLLEANPGADVSVNEVGGKTYSARIIGVPERSIEELERTDLESNILRPTAMGTVILLKTLLGTAAVQRERIQDVTFAGAYKRTLTTEEYRNLLTLKLDWPGNAPAKTANVGMMYLQKGIRWIPSYKVSLDGKGNAVLSLQATLINEMTDLNDVTANLVVGVPSFFFQETPDPIGLQQAFAQLSPYFQNGSATGNAMSNSLMSQVGGFAGGGARAGERFKADAGGGNLGPEVAGGGKNEDTFIFTVKHVSLRKGQRMILPIAETTLKYRDVYTVDVAFAPPRDIRQNGNLSEQQLELLRLQNRPKAQHIIRLTNSSKFPLTTAPALILSDGKVLAQGLMTYTSIGGETDLTLTTAVDVKVKKTDKETSRTPNAAQWQGNQYGRVDLAGTLSITNYQPQTVDIEVTRNVLGNVAHAEQGGVISAVNTLEDDDAGARPENPSWWNGYSWPGWWSHFNGMGRITWKLKLEPGKSIDLKYTWNYFWQ